MFAASAYITLITLSHVVCRLGRFLMPTSSRDVGDPDPVTKPLRYDEFRERHAGLWTPAGLWISPPMP